MILDRSLPTRCRRVSLGDLVVDGPTNGYSGPTGPDAKGSPTLRLSATTSGTCVLDETTTKRLYETIPPDSDLWLEPGDLLVQRSNTIDLVGTAAIYDGPRRSYIYPDLIMRLRLREATTARFVWRYINSPAGRTFFSRMAAGSSGSMPKITGAKLRTMQIPLPPLAEQRRIAEVLDRAEALRAKRRAALALLDTLTQALFLDLFGDPATNPKVWKQSLLKYCTSQIQIGPFGSLLHQEDYVLGGVSLINPMHIQGGQIVPDPRQSVTVQKHAELQLYHLRQGDVIMGRRGEMGRCAIVTSEHDGMLCGTGSLFIRPDESKATAIYLQATLSSATMRKRLGVVNK